jgi:hypothetical protein
VVFTSGGTLTLTSTNPYVPLPYNIIYGEWGSGNIANQP